MGLSTVEKLAQALDFAKSAGFEVRFEYLQGEGGGACFFGNRRWLFVDLAMSVAEQLEAVELAMAEFRNAAVGPADAA